MTDMTDTDSILEKDHLLGSPVPSPAPKRRLSLFVSLVALSHIVLIALVAYLVRLRVLDQHQHQHQLPIPLGGLPQIGNAPDWLPPERWRTDVFRPDPAYESEYDDKARDAWLSLMPKGKGFVTIRNDSQLPPMPGLHHPDMRAEQQAGLAVFHQLHCLYSLYTAYWDARTGTDNVAATKHLGHCWDYLRQTIMCAGDTTLEWVSEYSRSPNATDGWGIQHTCKDFGAIWSWAEEHRDREDAGIV